jgi:hypothetical protein
MTQTTNPSGPKLLGELIEPILAAKPYRWERMAAAFAGVGMEMTHSAFLRKIVQSHLTKQCFHIN